MCLVASEKGALAKLRADKNVTQSHELGDLMNRYNALLDVIQDCTKTVDSLTDSLATSGLEDLRGETFKEWLCDIGLGKL